MAGAVCLLLLLCSIARNDGYFLRGLEHMHAIDEPLEKATDSAKEGSKKVEKATKPSKEKQQQWKDGVKTSIKSIEPKNMDWDDLPGVPADVKKDIKKPWKAQKKERKKLEKALEGEEAALREYMFAFASAFFWFLLRCLLAYYYRGNYASPDLKLATTITADDWSTRICDCAAGFSSPSVCCMSCLLPDVRWAQTVAMARIEDFWRAFLCFNLGGLLSGIPIFMPITALIDTYERSILRQSLGMPEMDCRACVGDCCCFMCCGPCMIAQEARHVEALAAAGL